MKHRKSPVQRLEEFILTNRGTTGTPRLFALATGLEVEVVDAVLQTIENRVVIQLRPGIWGYNPAYRHERQPVPAAELNAVATVST